MKWQLRMDHVVKWKTTDGPTGKMEDRCEEAAEAEALADFLRSHEWLSRCWLTNFCSDGYWDELPPTWRSALLALSDSELQRLATDLAVPADWPSSLRHLVLTARRVAPPREALAEDGASEVSPWLLDNLPHARNMGPKKQHEVRCRVSRSRDIWISLSTLACPLCTAHPEVWGS